MLYLLSLSSFVFLNHTQIWFCKIYIRIFLNCFEIIKGKCIKICKHGEKIILIFISVIRLHLQEMRHTDKHKLAPQHTNFFFFIVVDILACSLFPFFYHILLKLIIILWAILWQDLHALLMKQKATSTVAD